MTLHKVICLVRDVNERKRHKMLEDAKTVLKPFGAKLEPFPTLILVLWSPFREGGIAFFTLLISSC